MKKTFTINLGGKVLNIDDDALESLQQYINALKAQRGSALTNNTPRRAVETCPGLEYRDIAQVRL